MEHKFVSEVCDIPTRRSIMMSTYVAMARSSSGVAMICYVLPVLWMT